jgi:hypothetical protein
MTRIKTTQYMNSYLFTAIHSADLRHRSAVASVTVRSISAIRIPLGSEWPGLRQLRVAACSGAWRAHNERLPHSHHPDHPRQALTHMGVPEAPGVRARIFVIVVGDAQTRELVVEGAVLREQAVFGAAVEIDGWWPTTGGDQSRRKRRRIVRLPRREVASIDLGAGALEVAVQQRVDRRCVPGWEDERRPADQQA